MERLTPDSAREQTKARDAFDRVTFFGWKKGLAAITLGLAASFFLFGYLFHTQREFLQVTMRRLPSLLVLALITFPVSTFMSILDNAAHGSSMELHLYSVLANALTTWALIYVFIGGALRYFDRRVLAIAFALEQVIGEVVDSGE